MTLLIRLVALVFVVGAAEAAGQQPGPRQASPREAALVDLTGQWVSVITEDWRWRMITPAKGDTASVPLNAAGRKWPRRGISRPTGRGAACARPSVRRR